MSFPKPLSFAPAFLLGLGFALSGVASYADEFTERIVPFLQENCYDCHDGDAMSPKGDFDLFPFYTSEDAEGDRDAMLHIRNALHYREMPPHDRKQPELAERQAIIDWLDQKLLLQPTLKNEVHDPGPPQMRRLTRLEYNNTVRDLLGLDTDVFIFSERLMARRDYFDPSVDAMPSELNIVIPEYGSRVPALLRLASLPGDNRAAHGFFNQGDGLNITPLLIKRYLSVASEIVAQEDFGRNARKLSSLTGIEPAPPASRSSGGQTGSGVVLAKLQRDFAPVDNITTNAPGNSDQDWLFRDQISGAFEIGMGGVFQHPETIGARLAGKGGILRASFGRSGEKALLINPTEDLWFVDFGTAHETSPSANIANHQKKLKQFRLDLKLDGVREDEGILNLGVVVLSRSKESVGPVTLTARFASGESAALTEPIATGAGNDNTFFSWYAPAGDEIVSLEVDGSQFSGDYVLLDDLGIITGKVVPIEAKAPPAIPDKTPVTAAAPQEQTDREAFAEFVQRAFRREVSDAEVEPFFAYFEQGLADGAPREEALAEAVRAVLASPEFLFLTESAPAEVEGPTRALDNYEIANRLSYFLWATMPDEALFAAAAAGELATAKGIEKQVLRMLQDPKAKELSDSFAYQWLRLNVLLGSQPNERRFGDFYDGPMGKTTMAAPLLQEALLLFETCLIENRPLFDLIDPDFTWLNPSLIHYYGFEDRFAEHLASAESIDKNGRKRLDQSRWFRCELPDRTRGGILCLGSTLTLTSLPLRTSPVYRGAWVAEVVFNRAPPPPPAAVDELGADDRKMQEAGLSLREKLEQHRNQKNCAGCHTRIDPLGFPLENFDAIGQWREDYGNQDFPVDSAGVLMDTYSYSNIIEFKDALAERKEDFHLGFVRYLLTYALGRHLEPTDEKTVRDLVTVADDGGLKDLIIALTKSETFRMVRAPGE